MDVEDIVQTEYEDDEYKQYQDFIQNCGGQYSSLENIANECSNIYISCKYRKSQIENSMLLLKACNYVVNNRFFFIWYYWIQQLNNEYLRKYYRMKIHTFKYLQNSKLNQIKVLHKCPTCGVIKIITPTDQIDLNCLINRNKINTYNTKIEKRFECDNCTTLKQKEDLKTIDVLIRMSYKDYLKTEHWQKTRISALIKSGYKCQLCGSTHNLNVHHNTYKNRGNEKPEDLIVLCKDCHAKFHDKIT